jgi:tetratricopeptide (TPR) repeat protein
MYARSLGVIWSRLRAWVRHHPWQAITTLVLLVAILGWVGFRASRYYAARTNFRAAQHALERHQWADADKYITAYLRAWPDNPDAHRLAARAARRLQHYREAKEHLDTCERLQGGPTQATKVERALLRLQRGDLAGAESFLREAATRDDSDAAEILDLLAAALVLNRRVPEAHRCLEELLQKRPHDFELLMRHAGTAESQGWHTVAVESLNKALTLRPDDSVTRLSLAQELVTVGRYADAREHLDVLRRKEPDNPAAVFTLARCLAQQGDKQQAGNLLDGLLARDPNNPTLLAERAWCYLDLDRPAEAEPYLRRALAQGPPNQRLLTGLADCLRLLGKTDEARRFREEAEKIRADTVKVAQLAKRVREERPVDPDLCHELACAYLRLGQEQNALFFFEKALEQDPDHRPTRASLAAFKQRQRR